MACRRPGNRNAAHPSAFTGADCYNFANTILFGNPPKPDQSYPGPTMKRCPECSASRPYKLSDGWFKCRVCGKRFSWTSIWDSVRLSSREKTHLLELFVLGVPVYRQRFDTSVSAKSRERFYRLIRACMAQQEQLREPFAGTLECDETTFGGGSTRQTRLGCSRQGGGLRHRQAQWLSEGCPHRSARPGGHHGPDSGSPSRGVAVLHRCQAGIRHFEATR